MFDEVISLDFTEINRLNEMLTAEKIPHTMAPIWDGLQITLYADKSKSKSLDDVVIHSYSHGSDRGLLETFCLGECNGYETAEEVFEGWKKKYFSQTP